MTVTVRCYGKETEYKTREEAIVYFANACACSEGSEQERYAKILSQLLNGSNECTDECE